MKLGAFQASPKVDADLSYIFSAMFNGGSGFVTIIAPFPAFDCVEFP